MSAVTGESVAVPFASRRPAPGSTVATANVSGALPGHVRSRTVAVTSVSASVVFTVSSRSVTVVPRSASSRNVTLNGFVAGAAAAAGVAAVAGGATGELTG